MNSEKTLVPDESGAERGPETLYDAVRRLPDGVLQEMSALAGGACYVVDAGMVGRNVGRLLGAMRREYGRSEVAYSYKANYGKAVIGAARAAGALSEVVSLLELGHAGALGIPDGEILCNGPGKTGAILRAVGRGLSGVICDGKATQLVPEAHRWWFGDF